MMFRNLSAGSQEIFNETEQGMSETHRVAFLLTLLAIRNAHNMGRLTAEQKNFLKQQLRSGGSLLCPLVYDRMNEAEQLILTCEDSLRSFTIRGGEQNYQANVELWLNAELQEVDTPPLQDRSAEILERAQHLFIDPRRCLCEFGPVVVPGRCPRCESMLTTTEGLARMNSRVGGAMGAPAEDPDEV
jgi:hypothetical protein